MTMTYASGDKNMYERKDNKLGGHGTHTRPDV